MFKHQQERFLFCNSKNCATPGWNVFKNKPGTWQNIIDPALGYHDSIKDFWISFPWVLSGVNKIQSYSSWGQMHNRVCQWCSAIPRTSSKRNSCQIDGFFPLALHKGWNYGRHATITTSSHSTSSPPQHRPPELLAAAKELHWAPFCLLAKAEKEWALLRTIPFCLTHEYIWWDHNNWAVKSWTTHPADAVHFLHQSYHDWII